MTKTIPAVKLPKATTQELIAQYDLAISSYNGRYSNTNPRQKRINLIVDLLSKRDDEGDVIASAWYDETN